MTESFWESEVVEEKQPEEPVEKPAEEPTEEPAGETISLALSVDEFSALEERVLRAVDLVKHERQTRAAAEERASQVEAQLREQAPVAEKLQKEVEGLRTERDQVRKRIERLLAQLDALEL
jgi:FtsZ-binding cell division protein ZapB